MLTALTVVVGAISLAGFAQPAPTEAAPVSSPSALLPSGPPRGSLDSVVPGPHGIVASGWGLDPDTVASIPVHIYVDGQGTAATADVPRPDIAAAFPAYGAAHGFHVVVSTPPGTHSVCVWAIDQVGTPASNTLLGCRTVTVLSGLPIGHVDSIQIIPGGVVVRGWALDPLDDDPVQVQLSGEVFSQTEPEWDGWTQADLPRPDVAAAFPGYGGAHGFVVVSSIPVWGAREFSVHAYAQVNGVSVRHAPIYGFGAPDSGNWPARWQIPEPSPFGSLDAVAQTGVHQVSLSGWSIDLDASATAEVHIYADGRFVTQIDATSARADVAGAYPFGSSHGFSTSIAVTSPGPHSICAYGINQNVGGNTLLGCRTVVVAAGSPSGSIDRAAVTGPGAATLSGWALDPDATAPTTVRVSVDGQTAAQTTTSMSRPDVDAAFPLFGSAHGWTVQLTGLPSGARRVCVTAVDQGEPVSTDTSLGCRTLFVPGGLPVGALDLASTGSDGITVAGWALDPDTTSAVTVRVAVDGVVSTTATADGERQDIAAAYPGYGSAHGYSLTLSGVASGPHSICTFALDATNGAAALLGCARVSVA